jgi:glycerol-1-phosphate dehydrogenase [NAD(P)+]
MTRVWPLPELQYLPLTDNHEARDVALVYSAAARDAVAERLASLRVVWSAEPAGAIEAEWRRLAEECVGEVVYSVGGGLATDAAKYIAARRGLPLVCIPTALSVDAFFTWASGVRRDGCVQYIPTKTPDRVVVDFEVIAAAPPSVRAAGIGDVLSIATGSWDWRYAHERGANPGGAAYDAGVDRIAAALLAEAIECADAAGAGDEVGLRRLIDCLALEVQLCNLIGHSRPEEGSEHYFAYAAESILGHGLPHGDLVGPGILVMAALQGQDTRSLRRALVACHTPLDTIPAEVIERTLRGLPHYCRAHDLPHGIAHDITDDMVSSAMSALPL